MIKTVFIDMDDTLIVNQILYEHAFATLKGYLRSFGVSSAEAVKAFSDIEAVNYPKLGYSRERYPASFEQTLLHFAPNADADMIATVRGFAEEVFTTVAAVKPGTPEAIDILTSLYPVYIVTQGDLSVQQERIKHLPFKDKLAGTFIVDKKDDETFRKLTAQLQLLPHETVMIGDSLKSDIHTAASAGLKAIWIEAHNASFEKAPALPASNAYKFSSLLEAARHLQVFGIASQPAAEKRKTTPGLKKK